MTLQDPLGFFLFYGALLAMTCLFVLVFTMIRKRNKILDPLDDSRLESPVDLEVKTPNGIVILKVNALNKLRYDLRGGDADAFPLFAQAERHGNGTYYVMRDNGKFELIDIRGLVEILKDKAVASPGSRVVKT